MKDEIIIKIPFNTDDFYGSIVQSIKYGLLITFPTIYFIIVFVIISSVKSGTVSFSDTQFFIYFIITIIFVASFWLSWAGVTSLFEEQIEIKNSLQVRIFHKLSKKEKTINVDKFKHILWEKEKLPIYGMRYGVFLMGSNTERYKLVSNHFVFKDNIKFRDFLEKLSNALSIPLKEELYISEGGKRFHTKDNYTEAVGIEKIRKRFRHFIVFIATFIVISSLIAAHIKTLKSFVLIGIMTTILSTFFYSIGSCGIGKIAKEFRFNYLFNILIMIPIGSLYAFFLVFFILILK